MRSNHTKHSHAKKSRTTNRVRNVSIALNVIALSIFGLAALGDVAVGATPPVGELYVANYSSGGVSQLGINSTGVASHLPYPTAPSTSRPSHVVVSPNGKYVYALDCVAGVVNQYTVDTAGLLLGSAVPMTPATEYFGGCFAGPSQPMGHTLAEAKTGKFVYVAAVVGSSLNTLLEYKVGSTGALTQFAAHDIPSLSVNAVATAPSGKFVYVADPGGLIFQFNISTTGAITGGPVTSTPGCPSDIAVAPSGKNLYAVNNCTNQITTFAVNLTTGNLSAPLNQPTGGAGSSAVAVAPNGKTLYVANATSNSVSQFVVSATGQPSPLAPAALAVGAKPLGLVVSKTSKNLYVSANTTGNVTEFSISTTTHLLTPIGSIAAGAGAWGIAVRP